jgi:ABC-type glycerol-3-phosphate transport system substrate-binding protein
MYAFLEQGQPPARASIWSSPEAQKVHPIWGRAATWLTDGKNEGPFPMPNNLRFSELQDKWNNLSQPMFYGEVGFDEGMKQIQEECQAIVALPRG